MTSKRTVLGWLAALALVAAACGGGGDVAPAPLAAADVPIVPEVAGDAPPAEEGEAIVEEGAPVDGEPAAEAEAEPDPEPEAEPEPEPESYTYSSMLERAATMMVMPDDLAGAVPDLRLVGAFTGPVDGFDWYRRNVEAVGERPAAGYEALLVGPASDESRERLGSPHPEVAMLIVEVELYGDNGAADARLAELRAAYEDAADQPGVPGDGFVVDGEAAGVPTVMVNMAGHGTVGRVMAVGTTSTEPAVAAAQALAIRMWKAGEGLLAPRDPLADPVGYQVPSAALDAFKATSDVVVSVDGFVLERLRTTGMYDGADRFSCQRTHYVGGTEELVGEVVAMDGEASVFDLASLSSAKYDLYSPEVAAAVEGCPVFPDAWQEYFLPEPALLHAEWASTIGGPGTALRTRDEGRLGRAIGLEPAAGGDLDDFSIFVTDEGWASAIHFDVSFPPEVSAERYGIAETVKVSTSVRVTGIEAVVVPEPLYFGDGDSFAVGVGEEVVPPADEPAPAEGDGGDSPAASADDGGEPGAADGGDVQAAGGGDDGLFGSGQFANGSGSDDGHFAGTTPVGGAEDVAAQEAVRTTMLGLVTFYVDNGTYLATPTDVAYYVGVVTTTDPGQAGSASTVFVPGDQETVVWAAGGSGYWCMAAQSNEVIVFGEGATSADVDTFAECVTDGSTVGW